MNRVEQRLLVRYVVVDLEAKLTGIAHTQHARASGADVELARVERCKRITADIFGVPVERPHTFETSGLGAAIAAAVGAGIHPDFKSAVAAMTRLGDRFSPVYGNRKIYDELYSSVYCKLYNSLRPGYRAIQAITH